MYAPVLLVGLLLLSDAAPSPAPEPLSFHEFFESSASALRPSARLLALVGKRVRLVGYMARMESPPKVKKLPGKIFGQAIEWDSWEKDGVSTREVIVGMPAPSNLKTHVFFAGPSAAANDELQRVAETLR